MSDSGDVRIDHLMPVLSSRWGTVAFEDSLVQRQSKYKKLKSNQFYTSGTIPVIDQGEAFITGYTDDSTAAYSGPLPVIIFGDHTRRFKYVDFEFAIGADGTRPLYPCDALSPKFFYHYLTALNLESQGYSRHYRFLKEASVPIPPLNEQCRIVEKLELLISKVNGCKERLNRIPFILKRFRQSILAAACSGRLTADWRNTEDIIQAETWEETKLSSICTSITDGDHLPPPKQSTGIPFLTIGNISSGKLDFTQTRFVSESYFKKIKPDRIPKLGDILYTVVGATIGIPVLVDEDRPFCFQRHIAILKPSIRTTSQYLKIIMSSPAVFSAAWAGTTGSAQPTLPLGNLRNISVELPSLEEQQEIVRRVESLFTLADQLEVRYKKGKAYVDKLTQSILAKAFRGELVPQDPNDEPAEKLLERIRAGELPNQKCHA